MVSQHPAPPPFNPIVPTSENTPSPGADSSQTDYPSSTSNTANVARSKDPTPQPPTSISAPPSSSSLNPHMSHAHDSVVPDLMRVYESMTGASASVDITSEHQNQNYQYQQQQESGGGYYPPWTYETSNIPIPPIPENSFAAMTAASAAAAAAVASSQQDEIGSNASTSSSIRGRNSRSLRKRRSASANIDKTVEITSNSSKSRRKNTKDDGRWSKRFTWPEDLHRDFVSAVFDVGLKNSSPSAILEHMPPHEQVTTERIKSHLQKYRLHRAKSKKEFLSSYSVTLAKMQKEGTSTTKSLAGGEVAGHLAYVTLAGHDVPEETAVDNNPEAAAAAAASVDNSAAAAQPSSSSSQGQQQHQHHQQQQQDCLIFPRLTEEEKRSPIGNSMGYLMGLFFTLKQQLDLEREAKKSKNASVVSNVYQSFVHGHAPADSFDSTTGMAGATTTTTAAAGGRVTATKTTGPSTRSNLEENTLMKREMQIQMAFQNKMRALKQQEVAKYKADQQLQQQQYSSTEHDMEITPHHGHHHYHHHHHAAGKQALPPSLEDMQQGAGEQQETADRGGGGGGDMNDDGQSQQQQQEQGQRTMSIGNADDFWNTDVVDDQLFEFLMNN